jgi:hypothetical protein
MTFETLICQKLNCRIELKKCLKLTILLKCLVIPRAEEEGMSIRQIAQRYNINKNGD